MSKISPSNRSLSVNIGCALERGWKETQEDFAVCVNLNKYISNPPNNDMRIYCAIFDGHGGGEASKFLALQFHKSLAQHPLICSNPGLALQETWRRMDDKLYKYLKTEYGVLRDGSTATVCLISGHQLFVVNCGDSSAFIERPDGSHAKVTEDHSTSNPAEVSRCRNSGAVVEQSPPQSSMIPCCFFFRPIHTPLRVYPGGLIVTRSFGDFYAKLPLLGGIKGTVIHHHGEMQTYRLFKDFRMVVLASDGVWDAFRPSEVFKIIRQHLDLRRPHCNPKANATAMREGPCEENLIANRADLNEMMTTAARDLCLRATVSDYWKKNRYAPDNASCILIAVD
mmetsp:Transcript_8717/g.13017  ORF Transcript_8717/g.13017 Transcript_8717/m.13017 type:complete len:339 (-) Transcript_8717:215-1231(-)